MALSQGNPALASDFNNLANQISNKAGWYSGFSWSKKTVSAGTVIYAADVNNLKNAVDQLHTRRAACGNRNAGNSNCTVKTNNSNNGHCDQGSSYMRK